MRKIALPILTALCLASCAKTEEAAKQPGRIVIDPVITRATEVSFEDGDQIGLTITKQDGGTMYTENTLMTYGSGVFAGSLNWYAEGNDKAVLTAYYPYSASGAPASFSVKADQTAGYGQSDLMASRKPDVLPTVNSVGMVFKHMLTKMVINVTNESGANISSVVLKGSIPTADIDLDAQTATVDETASASDITAQQVTANTTYRAIVVPQTVAFTVAVGTSAGKTLTQALASATLVQGGQYNVNVRVLPESIVVTLSGEIENWTDEGEIGPGTAEVPFEEFADHFVYDGVEYDIATLANGTTWMAEPLRYIPAGYTPSADPLADSHIWYPYATDGTDCTALTDETSIAALGYLYDYQLALGGTEITDANMASFEGVQGICPKGWHIPTHADYFDLCGKANGVADKTDAMFYDSGYTGGKMTKAVDGGFNPVLAGVRMQSNFTATPSYQKTITTSANCDVAGWVGKPSVNYYMTSTHYQATANNIQFYAMGTTFSASYKEGRLSLMYAGIKSGLQVRCMKD